MGKSGYLCGRCKHLGTFTCNCCDGTSSFVEDFNRRPTRFDYTGKETTMSTIDNIRWHVTGVELERSMYREFKDDSIEVTLRGMVDGPVHQEDLITLDRVLERKLNLNSNSTKNVLNAIYGKRLEAQYVSYRGRVYNSFAVKDVIFNDPATIVFWEDGTKTVVKAQDEPYDPEKGLAMAFAKKAGDNRYEYYNVFKHYLKKYEKKYKNVVDEEKILNEAPVVRAYILLTNYLNGDDSVDLNEVAGFLGEFLE